MTTSEKLILLRGNRTQSEVAKSIGITTSAYSNYEQGIRTPRDTIKRKIADYYEKSVEYIFFDHIDHEM